MPIEARKDPPQTVKPVPGLLDHRLQLLGLVIGEAKPLHLDMPGAAAGQLLPEHLQGRVGVRQIAGVLQQQQTPARQPGHRLGHGDLLAAQVGDEAQEVVVASTQPRAGGRNVDREGPIGVK